MQSNDEAEDKDESEEVKLLCAVGDTCELCGAWSTINRCSLCRTAKYCSEECQARHWEDHKDYCNVLVRRTELGLDLYEASREGNEQEVTSLLSQGAEVGYKLEEQPDVGSFPLLIASSFGHEKVVRALLKAGAKPNQQGGQYSWSALFVAAQNNFPRIVCILLAGGADINLGNYQGTTPLYIACYSSNLDVVKLLVRARGINLNQCKEGGPSPLHIASHKGQADVVSVLLAAGSDVHLKSNTSFTALDAAIHFKHTAVIALLLAHITQTEGTEAADKAEVGAVLGALVCKVEEGVSN